MLVFAPWSSVKRVQPHPPITSSEFKKKKKPFPTIFSLPLTMHITGGGDEATSVGGFWKVEEEKEEKEGQM